MSNSILSTMNIARQMTLGKIVSISEDLFSVQPQPFNNTIAWNLGHIAATFDGLVFRAITGSNRLPQDFIAMFKGGTRPSDWTQTPPSKAELVDILKQQMNEANEYFAGNMDQVLEKPLQIRDFKLETAGDVIGFAAIHEMMHNTTILDLVKVIQHQNS
ncbi:DinB family protein [Brevibacillus migulae]|uniref:DinB family protein n=1 Tax=Brevibacillus migulae TaxID=1644114 RepID=UPI001430E059|nr:DinB family protein [Brevibacillus migulae]